MGRYSNLEIEQRIAAAKARRSKRLNLTGCGVCDQDLRELLMEPGIQLHGHRHPPSSRLANGDLSAMTDLYLDGNRLTVLPPEIGYLTPLLRLYLKDNLLTAVPPEIGRLLSLEGLDLSGNRLTSVPPEIGRLASLTALHLDRNELRALPPEIRMLTDLRRLYLHGNEALGIPPEILGPTVEEVYGPDEPRPAHPHAILDYYFRIEGTAGRPLAECKVIVVGRGGAGKTSLVKRINGEAFDPYEPETHGITIRKIALPSTAGTVTGRVWDFGGQVVLHSMHEFFLTTRTLYLLVLGERDDMLERDAAYWLQLIRSYAGNAPVVVALNRSAGRQRQFDRATLEKSYGPILGWVATECSDVDAVRSGIAALKRELTAAIDGPHMQAVRDRFPRNWFAVKDALESMDEPYLDYAEYVMKCERNGVADADSQARLAARLHELGVTMSYGNDPRLRDTSVLKPNWLANGIYAVLRANDQDDRLPPGLNTVLVPEGVVNADLMGHIHQKAEAWNMLRTADYPADKREFLLRLMDLFHLSYPLNREEGLHLVPSLLPLHPPQGAEEPGMSADRIRLRYEFHVVPAPLLPGFIARTFSLVPDRLHWRRGVVVAYGASRGLVWTTQDERYIYVTVAGQHDDRDELLTMVRGMLKELFAGYRGLVVKEQWEHDSEWVPRKTLEQFGRLEPDEPPRTLSVVGNQSEEGLR